MGLLAAFLVVCLCWMCWGEICHFPPFGTVDQVVEGVKDEFQCASKAVESSQPGFSFKDGICKTKATVSKDFFGDSSKVEVDHGVIKKFSKPHDVEKLAKSLGYDVKVEFPFDGSVRHYMQLYVEQKVSHCERFCLDNHGTQPLLYTRDHISHLKNHLGLIEGPIGLGLRFQRKYSKVFSYWLDGTVFYKGSIYDMRTSCMDDDFLNQWETFVIFDSKHFILTVQSDPFEMFAADW